MGDIPFEKCKRGEAQDQWIPVTIDEIRKVTTATERDLMIFHKAVIRKDEWKYRRQVPNNPKDWSKEPR